MTAFLGFRPNEGEYKVMGLAPYGTSEKYIDKVRELIKYENDTLICNMDVFSWNRSDIYMFNYKLTNLLDLLPRSQNDEITQDHKDLAAAVQQRYEEVLFDIIETLPVLEKDENLCMSGGCAYNGTANGKITEKTGFKKLWIPLAPSDAGSCIGACVNYLVENNKLTEKINRNPFIGPIYMFDKYLPTVKGIKIFKISSSESLVRIIARKLSGGKVVGWYQGHNEFGARALGNRSILANPTIPGMKDKINKLVKKRENFRPFAPMVIKEKQNIFFKMDDDIPYMNQIVKVNPEYIDMLPAVTHVDNSARVQTVYKHTLTHDLLLEFEKLTGFPILLNTSFNIKDKTMVLTPKDAIETFKNTEIDILVMGNYIIYK
jgi:carbamoyltransferase